MGSSNRVRILALSILAVGFLTFYYGIRSRPMPVRKAAHPNGPAQSYSADDEVEEEHIEDNEGSVPEGDDRPSTRAPGIFKGTTCALPITSNISELLVPLKRHEVVSYVLPEPSKRTLLNDRMLEDSAVYVFVHVNKAGGTLIKEEVFRPVAHERKWSGVGYGTAVGWKQLLKCVSGDKSKTYVPDSALNCGNMVPLAPCGPLGGGNCPNRLIWGTHSMGLCELYPDKPCVMTIVFRDPVERLISQYNYVCVEGKEDRKKWLPAWREAGRCPLSLLEFLDTDLTSTTFLIDHMARAADPQCSVELALHNLLHPCLRFLLLDRLADGLARLAKIWGPAMRPYLEKVATAAASEKRNASPYEARVKTQMDDPQIVSKLRAKLRADIEFYEAAVKMYEWQWNQPLHSCTPLP